MFAVWIHQFQTFTVNLQISTCMFFSGMCTIHGTTSLTTLNDKTYRILIILPINEIIWRCPLENMLHIIFWTKYYSSAQLTKHFCNSFLTPQSFKHHHNCVRYKAFIKVKLNLIQAHIFHPSNTKCSFLSPKEEQSTTNNMNIDWCILYLVHATTSTICKCWQV